MNTSSQNLGKKALAETEKGHLIHSLHNEGIKDSGIILVGYLVNLSVKDSGDEVSMSFLGTLHNFFLISFRKLFLIYNLKLLCCNLNTFFFNFFLSSFLF